MTSPSDFVNVELSAAGVAAAGVSGQLRFANGHMNYTFKPGTPVRVLTSEWGRKLSKAAIKGALIFQLVQAAAAPATVSSTTVPPAAAADKAKDTAKLTALRAQEAVLESQIAKEGN